jgi:hypothetical protein
LQQSWRKRLRATGWGKKEKENYGCVLRERPAEIQPAEACMAGLAPYGF